jgi:single-strand DNA-binding protein
MSSLNRVCLIGNLGADPEVRHTQSGGMIVNMRIATNEKWNDKHSGEKRERTEWHTIAIFSEGLGKVAERYLRKGSKVYVEGKLATEKWQDKNGNDRYTTKVIMDAYHGKLVMLGDGKGGGREGDYGYDDERPAKQVDRGGNGATNGSGNGYGEHRGGGRPSLEDELSDSIPF